MLIFKACVCSKLAYGLFTATLHSKEKRRIDGFHARCLRQILGIAHSYVSRISNETMLKIAGETPLSDQILNQQRNYMMKLVDRDANDPTRLFIFEPGSTELRKLTAPKGRGRPRERWVIQVHKTYFSKVYINVGYNQDPIINVLFVF